MHAAAPPQAVRARGKSAPSAVTCRSEAFYLAKIFWFTRSTQRSKLSLKSKRRADTLTRGRDDGMGAAQKFAPEDVPVGYDPGRWIGISYPSADWKAI